MSDVGARMADSFRTLFESVMDAVVITDPAGVIVDVNPAALELFGAPRSELVGAPDHRFVSSRDDVDSLRAQLQQDGQLRVDLELRRADGAARLVECVARAEFVPERTLVVLRDVTEKRAVERTLRQTEEKFAKAFRVGPLPIVIVRASDARYIEVNDAFLRLVARPREVVIGRTPEELGIIRAGARAAAAESVARRQPPFQIELDVHRPSGESRRVLLATEPLELEGEACYIVVLHDLTDLRRTEEQLRQSQKLEAIGSLAGGVAHDFNNLLSVIIGEAEMALEDVPPGAVARTELENIHAASQRAAELTRQLLAFSRRQILTSQSLDLNVLLARLEKLLRRVVGESIQIATDLAADLGTVRIDPNQFEQVIVNVAVNARDAMRDGGKLTIETRNVELDAEYCATHLDASPGPHVLVSVTDSGCGMDADTRARIFEPFFTTKEQGRGTGLGLSTVFGIVKQHGGHVWVYSEPGKGTSLKFYFPRTDEPVVAQRAAEGDAGAACGESILLVEDDASVRGVAVRILERVGYRVTQAGTPSEALALAADAALQIDLLLTDVVMPEMSGRALAERILLARPGLKVLFMSGYTDDSVVRHGVLDGDMAFIQKPMQVEALARKIREVLDAEAGWARRDGG